MKTVTRWGLQQRQDLKFRRLRRELHDQVRSVQAGTLTNPYPDGYPDDQLRLGQFTGMLDLRTL